MRISKIAKGYDISTDPNTGIQFYIERATGECVEAISMTVPAGSYCVTPEQQRIDAETKQRQRAYFSEKEITKLLGRFYSLALDNGFSELSPATVARLVYLGTFLKYGTDCLYQTERTPMTRKMLPEIMNVSDDTTRRFMEEASPYIFEDEAGHLHMKWPTFIRGKLPPEHEGYQKIRIEAVRTLYLSTAVENHKRLGYIFLMLPFISIEHNILCHKPYASNIEEIQPMTVREFCEKVGLSYNKMTVSRLKRIYADIQFMVRGKPELFCAFTTDGVHHENDKIFVNPLVLYSGRDAVRVKGLIELMPKPHSHAPVTTLRKKK